MIGEFYKHEHLHGLEVSGADVTFTGSSTYFLKNNPSRQRKCTCKECGIVLIREVPRLEYQASYNYKAGHYCPECGLKRVAQQEAMLRRVKGIIEDEIKCAIALSKGLEEIINDEWYPKKMALGKMFGVMQEKAGSQEY